MDINCAVCGEPWDIWGANHGDMAAWEYDLFRKGAGCPCCEGENKDNANNVEQHMFSVMMNSDDPDAFSLMGGMDRTNKWIEPAPKVLWECAHCKVQAVLSNDCPYDGDKLPKDISGFVKWHGGKKVHYKNGHGPMSYSSMAFYNEVPDAESDCIFDGKSYCPGCACACNECGTVILINGAACNIDTYGSGASFPHPGNPFWGVVCLECFERESTCNECGEWLDDCKCEE